MADARPLLYLDIDGVVLVHGEPSADAPGVYVPHRIHPWPLPAPVDALMREEWPAWAGCLAERFDVVWCTTWRGEANRIMSPLLGLPDDLPLLPFDAWNTSEGLFGKTTCVAAHAAGRPFVWLDDQIRPADQAWLSEDPSVGDHLLVAVDERTGVTPGQMAGVLDWAVVARHG